MTEDISIHAHLDVIVLDIFQSPVSWWRRKIRYTFYKLVWKLALIARTWPITLAMTELRAIRQVSREWNGPSLEARRRIK